MLLPSTIDKSEDRRSPLDCQQELGTCLPRRAINANSKRFRQFSFASRSPRSAAQPNVQAIEVTRDKKVVWVLQDWKNLGQATTAQFLDQPGIPGIPGDLVH